MAWRIDRLEPGAVLRISYRGTLPGSASLSSTRATLGSVARVPEYFGQPAAAGVRRENDGGEDRVDVVLRFPHVSVTHAPATAPGDAEILQPFPWQIGVQNDSLVEARRLGAVDTLPANWRYVPGSTVIRVGEKAVSTGDPKVVSAGSGDTLTWATDVNVPAGTTATIRFSAEPQPAAGDVPGPGANVAVASATVTDANGALGNADRNYADGPVADTCPQSGEGSRASARASRSVADARGA